MADLNSGSPWNFQAPNVNMTGQGGMFPQAQSMVQGGGYPGGPSFGMAPQMAGQQIAMQNAMFGQQAARANMGWNMGLAGQNMKYHMATDISPYQIVSAGLLGAQDLSNSGTFSSPQAAQMSQMYGGGQGGMNPYGSSYGYGIGNQIGYGQPLPPQPATMSLPNY